MNNLCQAGHKEHDKVLINTEQGYMYVYDYDKYSGFHGYCTGQDDVSRTLINTGTWEPLETQIVSNLLSIGNKNDTVLDFGTHVGWFTLMAAKHGYKVIGWEGDFENADMVEMNLKFHKLESEIRREWVGPDVAKLPLQDVEFMKCDIEGNERFAVEICKDLFTNRKIKNALIEISPTFNDTYPPLVNFIKSCGYVAYDTGKDNMEFNDVYDFPQTNFLFVRS